MKRFASDTKLTISNAEFFAYHGVRNEERTLGGRFQVDADLVYDATNAVVSDDISDALNYEDVLFVINEHMNGEPAELIETLSFDIASSILERFDRVHSVTVRVRKLNVPIQAIIGSVQAEVTLAREQK